MNERSQTHRSAIGMLLLANLFWALSFPLIKALGFSHRQVLPDSGGWFVTAMTVAPRFVLATTVMVLIAWRQLRGTTPLEWKQGVLLGVSAALGMLFQNDGLQYTEASTSAFLTQFYAILIPIYVAVRARRRPPPILWISCGLVLVGVAVLARLNPLEFSLGRGETETLVSSCFFMWQILVLGHAGYAGNRVMPVTTVMFATETVIFCAMALGTASTPGDVLVPWSSGPWVGMTVLLTVFCTLGSFTIMNKWQPHITTTEAGLIYCMEPVFAAVMALFLPAMISGWAGFDYPNEMLTWHMLAGGGLITVANVLLQLRPPVSPPPESDGRS